MRALLRAAFSAHLWRIPFTPARRAKNARQWRNALGGLYRAYLTLFTLKAHRRLFRPCDVLYAYWLDNTATGLAMVKDKLAEFRNTPLVCRAHGYDVFEEQRGIFFPARDFALQHIDRVFAVSHVGTDYLRKRYPVHAHKIQCRHLGVENSRCPQSSAPEGHDDKNTLRVVSCANVIALKRLGLTMEMLKRYAQRHPQTPIVWTHFGTGPLWEQLRAEAQTDCPENLRIDWIGAAPNQTILERYSQGDFDIFLSLSSSEGMPVSAIEAMSCGIVPLCTDAGGTREAVNDTVGALLPVEIRYEDFEKAMNRIRNNYPELSRSAREKQQQDFCSEKNYDAFYREISRL